MSLRSILLLLAIVGMGFAVLPGYIEVDHDMVFSNDNFSTNVTVNFTAPATLTFRNITGSNAYIHLYGEGKLVVEDSLWAKSGVVFHPTAPGSLKATFIRFRGYGPSATLSALPSDLPKVEFVDSIVDGYSMDYIGDLTFDNTHLTTVTIDSMGPVSFKDSFAEDIYVDAERLEVNNTTIRHSEGHITSAMSVHYSTLEASSFYARDLFVRHSRITSSYHVIPPFGAPFTVYAPQDVLFSITGYADVEDSNFSVERGKTALKIGIGSLNASARVVGNYFLITGTKTPLDPIYDFNGETVGIKISTSHDGTFFVASNIFKGRGGIKLSYPNGIALFYYDSNGTVFNNTFSNLRSGVYAFQAIALCYGPPTHPICDASYSHVDICSNVFEGTFVPMFLYEAQEGRICNNTIINASAGLYVWDPVDVKVEDNSFRNAHYGIVLYSKSALGVASIENNVFDQVDVGIGPVVLHANDTNLSYSVVNNIFRTVGAMFRVVDGGHASLLSAPPSGFVQLSTYYNNAKTSIEDFVEYLSTDSTTYMYPKALPVARREVKIEEDKMFLGNSVGFVATVEDPYKIENITVYGTHTGIKFVELPKVDGELVPLSFSENDTANATVYLGDNVISIDTTKAPYLVGKEAKLYFKVPACGLIYRLKYVPGFLTNYQSILQLGQYLTVPTRCFYSEDLGGNVVEVTITVQ